MSLRLSLLLSFVIPCNIAEKAKKLVQRQGRKRIDNEFRVKEQYDLSADAKIKELITAKWPKYYREHLARGKRIGTNASI